MAPVNITSIKVTSDGVWQGENPLHYAFPLLIIQTTLVVVLSRILAFLLKPLRQPKVIAEIVGGILLGPSALGRSTAYLHAVFPKWSMPIIDSVANLGLLFFLFLVGLELDLNSIRRGGRKALFISMAGIALPFASGAGVAVLFRKAIDGADKVGYAQFLVFMGVALSITAFPVLARILAELKLLTTRVGELAMSAAAFDDVSAWILLALAIALAGSGDTQKSPIITVWVLLCGIAYITVMFVAVRLVMAHVARRCSSDHNGAVNETYIALTLAGVLVSGFLTDLIGIHAIFGGFIFGLMIPKEGAFAGKLIERIEDFVSGLMLPLYFASSGLKTNVATIKGAEAWGLLVLVIAVACAGKIIAVTTVALACKIPTRESITLGFLMNTKGLVELIVLNIGKEKKVLNDEMFAIMVLMALVTTFMTTPIVMAIYKPARRGATTSSSAYNRKLHGGTDTSSNDLHVLACLHGPSNVHAIVRLIDSLRAPSGKSSGRLKLYAMRLVELTERSSSIVMAQRLRRRNALPFSNRGRREENSADLIHDRLANSFLAYGQPGEGSRVTVKPVTTVSPISTMHEDVCQVAEEKEAAIIVLPFHKAWHLAEDDAVMKVESVGHEWRGVNQKVMKHAPCSVAVLVDRGFRVSTSKAEEEEEEDGREKVVVVFFGGPDDREALELGRRMVESVAAMKVEVVRFVERQGSDPDGNRIMPSPEKPPESSYTFSVAAMNRAAEKDLDNAAVAEFKRRCEGTAEYTERVVENVVKDVLSIAHTGGYDLIVVGKGRFPSTAMVAGLADLHAEHAELGPIGDILTSSTSGVMSSVLVVQQHSVSHVEEVPFSKIVHADVQSPA